MTYAEYAAWVAYRNKRGPLNPLLRQDGNFALIATLIAGAMGHRREVSDFMPWAKDDQEASVSDVMNLLIGGKRG